MKTFTLALFAAAALYPCSIHAQSDSIKQEQTILERLDAVEKKSDKLNIFLNMHGDFAVQESDGEYQGGKFQMRQLRIEAK